jgi:hypothetical protein
MKPKKGNRTEVVTGSKRNILGSSEEHKKMKPSDISGIKGNI